MMMNYVTKIRAKVNIYASKKTSNLFDGSYKSIYQGNGLDFENLREYIPGDSIRDIDWKASSRSGKTLVKRYMAEKKHNIMLVWDTGRKMSAHTRDLEVKQDLALNVGGIIGIWLRRMVIMLVQFIIAADWFNIISFELEPIILNEF